MIETWDWGYDDMEKNPHGYFVLITDYKRLEKRNKRLLELLSHWYESWSDGCNPDGDVLGDTLAGITVEVDNES